MTETSGGPVLLVVAWHYPTMLVMPRAFWHVRRLDRASRADTGLLWMHRWTSRRSVGLTARWQHGAALREWLASSAFREADAALRRLGGVRRIESAAGSVPLEELLDER